VVLWALDAARAASGLYNVGSGAARSFLDKAKTVFSETEVAPSVEFVDLPEILKRKY